MYIDFTVQVFGNSIFPCFHSNKCTSNEGKCYNIKGITKCERKKKLIVRFNISSPNTVFDNVELPT